MRSHGRGSPQGEILHLTRCGIHRCRRGGRNQSSHLPSRKCCMHFSFPTKNIESCDGDFSVSEMTLLVDHPLDEIGRPQRSVDQAN